MFDRVPFSACVFGKSGSGKTTLVFDLVYQLTRSRKIDDVIVFAGTSFQGEYAQKVGHKRVIDDVSSESLFAILDRLGEARRRGSTKNILLIIDD